MFATVYKVGRWHPEEGVVSAVVDDDWRYVYPVGVEIYPRIGYFYAFRTQEQALAFLRRENAALFSDSLQLWEAEAEIVDEPAPMIYDVSKLWSSGVYFWEHYENYRGHYSFQAPPGTVWCKSIQLERRVA